MYFKGALEEYKINFPTALAFALLLVFVLPLSQFESVFISSGLIGFEYGLSQINIISAFIVLLLLVVFLFFSSVFVSLMVFGVRKDLSKLKVDYYLNQQLIKFSSKLFFFNLMYSFCFLFLGIIFALFNVPLIVFFLLLFLSSIALFYFPQALVVDEISIRSSIASAFEFLMNNKKDSLKIIFVGSLVFTVLPALEFLIDLFFPAVGTYFILLISFVLIVPFIESWKTVLFLQKFGLIKPSFKDFHAKAYPKDEYRQFEYLKRLHSENIPKNPPE
ncbi:MAG: hypothetical protein ABIA76_03070 [Candidatus Diapherotrites archaeon]